MTKKVGIVTSQQYFGQQEDALLLDALRHAAVDAAVVAWDDATVNWASFHLLILRSCWNYHLNPKGFDVWLTQLDAVVNSVWNRTDVVRDNMDKRYLQVLEQHHVPVVPSLFFNNAHTGAICSEVVEQQWDTVVIKPAVSASAHNTKLIAASDLSQQLALFESILKVSSVLVQPFIKTVQTFGEYSLMFIDNEFSHAVLKTPATGDFRVQGEMGGVSRLVSVDDDQVELAHQAISVLDNNNHYARVDLIPYEKQFLVSEVELIDPEMFFRYRPESLNDFANAVIRAVV